jgi:hypothetical protein
MTIDMDNASFADDQYELQRIVTELAQDLNDWTIGTKCVLIDCNGNRVGEWSIE